MTFCNDALLKATGYRADEMIGKNLHELLHHRRPDEATYRAPEFGFSRAISAHQLIHVVGESYWRKDRTRFPAECWAHPFPHPIGPTQFVLTLQDLSETERLFARARKNSAESWPAPQDVAWTSDRNGKVI